jgi:hypothetical protein
MDNPTENIEQEEYNEDEESPCNDCAMNNYPEFTLEPDEEALQEGVREGSYVVGFVGALGALGFSEASLMPIIMAKIEYGHNKELMRMQNASEERKAEIWSKSKTAFIDTSGGDY